MRRTQKQYLVLPFLKALGYNPFDPTEVRREYNPEMTHAGQTRADYMILKEGKPIVSVECKKLDHALGADEVSQLADYFTYSDAVIGILTNGVKYRFFADSAKANVMDERPFFDFDVAEFEDGEADVIRWLTKSSFEQKQMVVAAKECRNVLDTNDSLSSKVAKEGLVELPQLQTHGVPESMRDKLDRAIKDILRYTVNVNLVRTEDRVTMLSVHLDNNGVQGRTTRLFRLVKMRSGEYNFQFADTQRSPSGEWRKAGLTAPIRIHDLAELHNYVDTLREMAARFYPSNTSS